MRTSQRRTSPAVSLTTTDILKLRLKAYAPQLSKAELKEFAKTGYIDEFDNTPNVKYFHEAGKAACRVHFGPVFPCTKYFDYVPLDGACEVSRLCIDPDIKEVGERMSLLIGLFRQVVQACWTREMYTSAEADLRKVYTRWMGFTDAPEAEVAEVPPGDEDVWLLRMDLGDPAMQKRVKALLGWKD